MNAETDCPQCAACEPEAAMQIVGCETCFGSRVLEMQDRWCHKEAVQTIMSSH